MVRGFDHSTPDSIGFANSGEFLAIINAFSTDLSSRGAVLLDESLTVFSDQLDSLTDYCFEITSILKKFELKSHRILWLVLLDDFVQTLLRFQSHFEKLETSIIGGQEFANQFEVMENKLGYILSTCHSTLVGFFSDISYDFYHFFMTEPHGQALLNRIRSITGNVLTLISSDNESVMFYMCNSTEILLSVDMYFYTLSNRMMKIEKGPSLKFFSSTFHVLGQFIRAIYALGESTLLTKYIETDAGFGPIITPVLPLEVLKETRVNLDSLLKYYKYTAFCLVELAVRDKGSINHSYTLKADLYFKILLNFPNQRSYEKFDLNNLNTERRYSLDTPKTPSCTIQRQLIERQEISLLYIINYLLSLTDVKDFIESENYFKTELWFIRNSLYSSNSDEIHRSTSRLGSTSSSLGSISSQANMSEWAAIRRDSVQGRQVAHKFISSILLQGSYKEKLILIIKFCDHLNSTPFTLPSFSEVKYGDSYESEFQHLVSIMDDKKYPGKLVYTNSLQKIFRLLKLLAVKHLVYNGGYNKIPESYIINVFRSNESFSESLKVKSLLDSQRFKNKEGEIIYAFNRNMGKDRDFKSEIKKQLEVLDRIKSLNGLSNLLN
ncbi:Piso0_002580 [Millerozyma farinosa CBS 7064]|uniref:Piso0_002580 protein n=1 Tax=Pichia sorbitophila (strain ATCC MYA-4447 / BCRC 22081 / CBS 7064 / NBRC 10061 / NRRL Y-12695) TaxID=559304 RepID=G8YCZ9_PICSO|nr:Piso0_002580 [Millerozyma farinosa CBS 7064]